MPLTSARVASACLTMLVSASATMKYAVASISAGNRSSGMSTSVGTSSRFTIALTAASQAAAGEDRREDPACQLAELLVPLLDRVERLADERFRLRIVVLKRSLGELERHDGVHEPLLGAVVEVADHAAAGLVAGDEQTRSRGEELLAAVGVRDRGLEQLRELADALLGVRGR